MLAPAAQKYTPEQRVRRGISRNLLSRDSRGESNPSFSRLLIPANEGAPPYAVFVGWDFLLFGRWFLSAESCGIQRVLFMRCFTTSRYRSQYGFRRLVDVTTLPSCLN